MLKRIRIYLGLHSTHRVPEARCRQGWTVQYHRAYHGNPRNPVNFKRNLELVALLCELTLVASESARPNGQT